MARDHYIRSPKWFDFEEGYDSYTRGVSTRTEASARTLPHARSIHAQSGSVRSIPFTPTTSWSKDPGDRWRKAWEAKHLKMKVNQGTAYPCNPSTLEKHELKPENCRKRHWSAPEATRLLEILLNLGRPNDEAQDKAIRRLADGMRVTTWSGDLVIKAFEDLDSTFFGGYLTDEVMVQWCSEDAFRGGPPAFGVCFSMNPSSSSRVKIHLNADEIFLRSDDPWKVMWRTIIHEMVHAYLQVMCGEQPSTDFDCQMGSTWTDGHGIYFRRIITAINRRLWRYLRITLLTPKTTSNEWCSQDLAITDHVANLFPTGDIDL